MSRYRRSAPHRAGAVVGLLAALALALVVLAPGEAGAGGALVALAVVLAALVSCAGAFGDLYAVDGAGIAYENRWLRRGLFAPWRAGWSEVEEARAWRGRMLLITLRGGARRVVDGVEGFERLLGEVEAARGAAAGPVSAASGAPSP